MTLEEVKAHLRLEPDETEEDELVLRPLIGDARDYAEGRQRKRLALRQFELLAHDDRSFQLHPPVSSILSVTVTDKDGIPTTLSPSMYSLYSDSYKASLVLSSGYKYPSVGENKYPVRIVFEAGMPPASVPRRTKRAILLLIGHWYENREDVEVRKKKHLPLAVDTLLDMDRTW